jgi:hypothetical protein
MINYKTTIGGAISTLGSSLIGIGVLPQFSVDLSPDYKATLWYLALSGYVINIIGKFLTSLFAADASALKEVVEQSNAIAQQTNVNTVQIADAKAALETKLTT